MKPMILLLAATALTGAAQPRTPRPGPPYEAGGFEPSWQLEISYRGGMIMTLQQDNGGGPAIFVTLRRL